MVHFKSNAFDKTILKIYVNSVVGKSYLLNVDGVTGGTEDETGFHGMCKSSSLSVRHSFSTETYLLCDFLLVFSREIDEMIEFCAHQKRNCSLSY